MILSRPIFECFGPIITAGGLVFIAAAMGNYLRAFDVSNGSQLWRGQLPAGGQATSMTYIWGAASTLSFTPVAACVWAPELAIL